MLAFVDVDGEGAFDALQLARSGTWHHSYLHFGTARVHGCKVLQRKAAVLAVERAGNYFNGHVPGEARLGVAARKHLA